MGRLTLSHAGHHQTSESPLITCVALPLTPLGSLRPPASEVEHDLAGRLAALDQALGDGPVVVDDQDVRAAELLGDHRAHGCVPADGQRIAVGAQGAAGIGDKWSMLVICALEPGTHRFSDLRRQIGSITQKMLTQTLRGLERDGLVTRRAFPTVPVTVEYTLSPLGRSLAGAVDGLRTWAYAHIDHIETARADFDARPTRRGHPRR